jgi:hypothetical protein
MKKKIDKSEIVFIILSIINITLLVLGLIVGLGVLKSIIMFLILTYINILTCCEIDMKTNNEEIITKKWSDLK